MVCKLSLRLGAALLLSCGPNMGLTTSLPRIVTPPDALNLGSTSFYDGFGGTQQGFTLLQYFRYESLDQITDSRGDSVALFKSPRLYVAVSNTQLSYMSPWQADGGRFGFSVLLPVIDFHSYFGPSGLVLRDSGLNTGDLSWGPIFQAAPIRHHGSPVFSWRAQCLVISPNGHFDTRRAINQGAGYWSIQPYVAMTALPLPGFEISARFNYLHAFPATRFADPPPVPHLIYQNGQGGELAWVNFTASYALAPPLSIGLNGFFLQQLADDRTNGIAVPHSEERLFYLGPGAHLSLPGHDSLNFNAYLPVEVKNNFAGVIGNIQFIHRF